MEEEIIKRIEKENIKGLEIHELCYDVFFKAVFERERDVLLDFICIFFNLDRENYDYNLSIGYEIPGINMYSKVNKTDILVTLDNKLYINIEVNKRSESSILSRNIVQLSRIYGIARKSGKSDKELMNIRCKQLNINTFDTYTGKEVEYLAICEKETGKLVSEILEICNVNIEKCYKMIYNEPIEELPKAVRIGAIFKSTSVKEISYILGEDIISMEKKKSFLKAIKEVNSDDRILQDWMLEENAKMMYENQMETAHDEGREENKLEVIQKMINKNMDFETISDIVGKDIKEIKKIHKKMKVKAVS